MTPARVARIWLALSVISTALWAIWRTPARRCEQAIAEERWALHDYEQWSTVSPTAAELLGDRTHTERAP